MAEAFTAGVRPGGLTDDTQIRMLLCYLVKVAGPVKRETMQGALLQEQLVNYFEFADALAEVEKQQLVTVDEDGRYTITRRGTTVADTLAYAYDDGVFHGYLYAVPDGMGIEFDKNSYLWDAENPIYSRYVMCGHDTRVAARLLAENWQQVVSTEDLVIYKRP